MPNDEEELTRTNTNDLEIMDEWEDGENYDEYVDDYLSAYLIRIDRDIASIYDILPVPNIKFYFDRDAAEKLQTALYCAPCSMDLRLTGEEDGITYVLNFNFKIDEDMWPAGDFRVALYRIKEDKTVETYGESNHAWKIVDPELVQMFAPDSRDEAVYELFLSLKAETGLPVVFFDTEYVKSTISENKKLFGLYRNVNQFAQFVADEELVSTLLTGLVPINPYRRQMIVFQTGEKLVLACVSSLDDEDPKLVAIYDTDSVDKMTEILNIMWDPDDEISATYPEISSGGIISMGPDLE